MIWKSIKLNQIIIIDRRLKLPLRNAFCLPAENWQSDDRGGFQQHWGNRHEETDAAQLEAREHISGCGTRPRELETSTNRHPR